MRSAQWPELEAVLIQWYRRREAEGGILTGDIICEKAREIWVQIPEYSGKPCPDFSHGWLHKFKQRHRVSLSEAPSQPEPVRQLTEEDMRNVFTLAEEFLGKSVKDISSQELG